jgi:hypothetical protein
VDEVLANVDAQSPAICKARANWKQAAGLRLVTCLW